MVEGPFKHMTHDHRFDPDGDGTLMVDRFEFTAPFGLLGRLAEKTLLTPHLLRFLEQRNDFLKRTAESTDGDRYLGANSFRRS